MTDGTGRNRLLQALALFGPIVAALFFAANPAGMSMTPGYSPVGQANSELMERGAPAKQVVHPLLLLYHGLVIRVCGGAAPWAAAGDARSCRTFADRPRGEGGSRPDALFALRKGLRAISETALHASYLHRRPMGIAILIGIWLTDGPCDGVPRLGAMPMSPQGLGFATALLTVARGRQRWASSSGCSRGPISNGMPSPA